MAILGTLGVLQEQVNDSFIFDGISFLSGTNLGEIFDRITPGNQEVIEIHEDKIFAVFQVYESKLPEETKMEGHERYVDLQYIYEGTERIDVCSLNDITEPDEYDDEKDVYFPKVGSYSSIILNPGNAAILFPEDIHAPGRCVDKPGLVKKVVVKIGVE